ncbi:diguanylate cyclase [Neptuniibacter pectenicola]|uniref:Diguanylate cyclase n=1 Tax=Neptuniibacter pectenicola TaxID=1806669 RepID=A0ABU9TPA4_9GAMM
MGRLTGFLVGIYLALCCYSPASLALVNDEITIGVLATRDKADVYERWAPLAELLNEKSETHTFNVKAYYFDELESAVASRSIAYVLVNPSFYVYLQELYGLSSPTLTMINQADGRFIKSFGGVIFTKANNRSITDLADLHNKKVAIVSYFSLGGYQSQAYALEHRYEGIGDSLDIMPLGRSQDDVVRRVLSGDADVGFVRTGILEQMVAEGALSFDQIKIINQQSLNAFPLIASTTLYPEWPFAALPYNDNEVTKYVVAELLKLAPEDAYSQAMKIGGFDIPENYSSITSLLRTQRLPPFDQDFTISLGDVWAQYKLSIILAITLLLSLIMGYLFLLRGHQKLTDTQHELAVERSLLEEIIWATQVGTWTWNVETRHVQINDRWAEMLGYTYDELMPITVDAWKALIHPDDIAAVENELNKHLAGKNNHYQQELRMRHKRGEWVWVLTQGKIVERDKAANPRRLSGINMDINSRKSLEAEKDAYSQQLEVLATKDSLTNLYNRRSFLEFGQTMFEQAKLNGNGLSFLMIDADHFKRVNDQYGHHAGDQVLKQIAAFLERNIRHADLLARLGGEEFGILMPATDKATALHIANRIADVAKLEVVPVEAEKLNFGLSIGVADISDGLETLSELMAEADQALYEVKALGRGFAKATACHR